MKLTFATGNSGKLREASEILGEGFELVSLADMGITEDIPETGNTLRANSVQKAQYLYDRIGCDCFADDTGLEVDALGGAPGVYTARYAGEDKDFNKNMDKVLYELSVLESESKMAAALGLKTKPVSRRARFKSVITLIINGEVKMFLPVPLPMAVSTRRLWTMKIRCSLKFWLRNWPGGIWTTLRSPRTIMTRSSPECPGICRSLRSPASRT